MAEHKQTPWSWHAKSDDQAHNGSIYRMERPGHAYAIAMQPRYVDDAEFAANAAFIVKAVNNHEALTADLAKAVDLLDGLLGLEKGSGQAAFEFVEQYRARVGQAGGSHEDR
jgi:hypothetical protein